MMVKPSFGQWLKQRRKTLDLTRDDLALQIGCAVVTLRKIEADERRPSQQMAELLAEHLNISPDERIAFVRFARGDAGDSAAPWGTPFQRPTNLPLQPTVLIGRDEDAAAVRKRLLQPELRLLTLIGPPGIGKTRLALQAAADVLDSFRDGVFYVALAPITDASLVLVTIANTLSIPDRGPQTPLQRLQSFLRDKQTLLVLDNFEQILAAAPDIAALLAALPLLKILVTSRAPLRIRQERQVPVSPLALPDLAHLPDVESVTHYSAITLFLERAQAVQPDFTLTEQNVSSVVAICTRLDGLPLAIELISARVKLLPPAALLERLRGQLMLQSDGLRDIEPRHRTLNAAIEWSYQLLSGEEQTLLRRLGVFMGGWTLEAAEAVCLENLNLSVLDGLTSLLDKSLIKQATSSTGEPRYMMLETVREYALERLGATGELEIVRERHAAYFLFLVETPAPTLTERQTRLWWDRLELEHPNFRAALTTSQAEQTGLRLAVALSEFWQRRSYLTEGKNWFVNLLSCFDEGWTSQVEARTLRAQALDCLGLFCLLQDDTIAAEPPLTESLAEFRELNNTAAAIGVLWECSVLFHVRGDFDHANAVLQEGLALSHASGYSEGVTMNLFFLGQLLTVRVMCPERVVCWKKL